MREQRRKAAFHTFIYNIPKHDILLVLVSDFNSNVGSDIHGRESVIGKHGIGELNDNEARLLLETYWNNISSQAEAQDILDIA